MAIDMEQFHQVFFEESLEGLDVMEQSLLSVGAGDKDAETINTIFRAAHSIKGGSGTFGFNDVADFTHVLETLLDEARDGKRELTDEAVELLLKSCDCLRDMINRLQAKQDTNAEMAAELINAFNAMLAGQPTPPAAEPAPTDTPSAPETNNHQPDDILMAEFDTLLNGDGDSTDNNDDGDHSGNPTWYIKFAPEPQILLTGNEPLRIFRELTSLGDLVCHADTSRIPSIDQLTADECFIHWQLELSTDAGREDIEEVFDWVIDECELEISNTPFVISDKTAPIDEPVDVSAAAEPAPIDIAPEEPTPPPAEAASQKTEATAQAPQVAKTEASSNSASKTAAAESAGANAASSSIRVGIDKVDSLINLVGELVITQSMLSELGNNFEMSKLERLANGLEQLLQNTKELQESVMRIRMLPISFAFNRFPRMIRDLSIKTGKKVDLQVHGESTELDKTVMEQISDPLVHLVRNAIDHGIETAEERADQGKPEQGTIRLDAYHQGGNIVIEVGDDGKGLNSNVIRTKAVEKGLIEADTFLSESEVFDLIFQPGFSTAQQVSDISGRGVGMDVVKRNIKSLGGRIHIESELGVGTTIKVHLPLTLAILDGQLVRVGDQVYIIPLITIVESLQIKPELVNRVAGDMVLYRLREDNVPIIPVYREFDIEADSTEIDNALLVVVEGDGQKVGLLVDDLLAQQQVVIKSLESNYKRVEGISGATILGDGSVSMILDIPGLIARASRRSNRNRAA